MKQKLGFKSFLFHIFNFIKKKIFFFLDFKSLEIVYLFIVFMNFSPRRKENSLDVFNSKKV